MRKPPFFICENKDAYQLCGNHEADQHLCFHFIDFSETIVGCDLKVGRYRQSRSFLDLGTRPFTYEN